MPSRPQERVMDPEELSPGSRRVAQRRDRVFRAAVELFMEQGYDNTTMDQVAERADVARASVFNYYQRKSAFLEEWSSRRRAHAADALRAVEGPLEGDGPGSVRDLLHLYLRDLAQLNESTREETIALLGASIRATDVLAHPPLAEVLHPYLVSARDAGEIAAGADVRQAAVVLASAYVANIAAWIDPGPPPFDLAPALDSIVDIVFDGLRGR